MAYNGLGTFLPLPPPTFPAVPGELIRADYFNATITDIHNGLSAAMTRSSQAPMLANLKMGGFKVTGAAAGVATDDLVTKAQLDSATLPGQDALNFLTFVTDPVVKASILDGTCTTDLTTALGEFRAALAASTVRRAGYFPAGLYPYATSPNWAIENLTIYSDGARFRHTGAGNAWICDAFLSSAVSRIPSYVYAIRWLGRTYIEERASGGGHGMYIRGVHHSRFESFNVRGCGAGASGLYGAFMVCNHFVDYVCSANEAPWYSTTAPGWGITLVAAPVGADGGTTSYCLFTNPIVEQVPIGIALVGTLGNLFLGGTSENCSDTGVFAGTGAYQDKFIGTDFEANANSDLNINGTGLTILDCDTTNKVILGGTGNRLKGGRHESLECPIGSSGNTFEEAMWNRSATTGTLVDLGQFNGFPRMRNAANSWFGRPLAITAVTVTASPMNIFNTTGDDQFYTVTGGTGVVLFMGRFGGGQVITYTSGAEYRVGPGEVLVVQYTTAPTISAYK
jgi:hypothetical protein